MAHKILLKASINGLIGSFLLSTIAVAQIPSPASSDTATPGPSHTSNSSTLPAFPGTTGSVPSGPHTLQGTPGNIPPPHTAPTAAITPPPPTATPPDDIYAKDPDLLMTPLHLGTTSLLFSKKDMDIIAQLLEIYHGTGNTPKQAAGFSNNDDLNNLLKELTKKNGSNNTPAAPVATLPNVYLASIVYYSPSHWSVWINGKKFINTRNAPDNEFYVSRISRTQAELVWKPPSLLDLGEKWKEHTAGGKNPLPGILVDTSKGTITLLMGPNQTFLPRSLAIAEGLIQSAPVVSGPLSETDNKTTH